MIADERSRDADQRARHQRSDWDRRSGARASPRRRRDRTAARRAMPMMSRSRKTTPGLSMVVISSMTAAQDRGRDANSPPGAAARTCRPPTFPCRYRSCACRIGLQAHAMEVRCRPDRRQQMAAGAALAAKRGAPKPPQGASREMVDSMSERQLREFASTSADFRARRAGEGACAGSECVPSACATRARE